MSQPEQGSERRNKIYRGVSLGMALDGTRVGVRALVMWQGILQGLDPVSGCQSAKRCEAWHVDVHANVFIASPGLPRISNLWCSLSPSSVSRTRRWFPGPRG